MGSNRVTLTDKIKEYRDNNNWSLKEMAQFLTIVLDKPVSLSSYVKIEKGDRSIKIEEGMAIARYCGIEANELIVKVEEE